MFDATWKEKTLGVIGGGNMAEALVRGVVSSGLVPAGRVVVFDILPERRAVFSAFGCGTVDSAAEIAHADAILLATKPQNLLQAVAGFPARPEQLVISIAAGVSTRTIESALHPGARVVRAMPNTPLLIGRGMTGLAGGANADVADVDAALALFSRSGDAVVVAEGQLDAVTALSGSGPAYLFRFAEALMAAGEGLGLSPDLAKRLAIGMLAGSAEMLAGDGDAPELRRRVTSPGGTTAAALAVFEERDFAGMVAAALAAARDRSVELGGGK